MSKEVEYAIKQLSGRILRDSGNAYNALLGTSRKSDEVYEHIDEFFAMMNADSSAVPRPRSYLRQRKMGQGEQNRRAYRRNSFAYNG